MRNRSPPVAGGLVEMDATLKFPIDLEQLPPTRKLRELFGLERALLVWWVLFQELKYRAQEGGLVGRIPKADRGGLESAIEERMGPGRVNGDGGAPPPGWLAALLESKLLVEDGDDYVCHRFAVLHGGEEPGGRTMSQRGGDMRSFTMKMRRLDESGAFQQSLHIADTKLVDEAGQPLDPDLVKRVTRLVVACDNALFKPTRPPMQFTEGLVQEALRVARRHTDAEVDYVVKTVARHRHHPALNGLTTERLLPRFEEVVRSLE